MLRIERGLYKNRKIKKPKIAKALQSKLRQKIFDYLREFIINADVLDLFAGAGTFGLEALSNGAKSVTFVEKNKSAIKTIQENIALLSLQHNTEVIKNDVIAYLNKAYQIRSKRFDIIFIDPPFKMLLNYTTERQKRYIRSLLYRSFKLLKPRSVVILKLHKHLPLSLMQGMAVLDVQKHGLNKVYYLVQLKYITKSQQKLLKYKNTKNNFVDINLPKPKRKLQHQEVRRIQEEDIYNIVTMENDTNNNVLS